MGYRIKMVRELGCRRGLAELLRYLADRIGPEDAFGGSSMTMWLREGTGWVLDRNGRRGTPIWTRRSQYDGEIYTTDLPGSP